MKRNKKAKRSEARDTSPRITETLVARQPRILEHYARRHKHRVAVGVYIVYTPNSARSRVDTAHTVAELVQAVAHLSKHAKVLGKHLGIAHTNFGHEARGVVQAVVSAKARSYVDECVPVVQQSVKGLVAQCCKRRNTVKFRIGINC